MLDDVLRIAREQLAGGGVDIDNDAGLGVEDQDPVRRGLKEPAIANLGRFQRAIATLALGGGRVEMHGGPPLQFTGVFSDEMGFG
jgi:hypothetical protein